MSVQWKPEGYPSVSPYLIVKGAERVAEFAKQTFEAEVLRRYERADGSIMHMELRMQDSVIMLGEALEGWPPAPSHLHVYVPDVRAAFERALEAGGSVIQEPVRQDDPDRRGGVLDPGGNTWWIATQEE